MIHSDGSLGSVGSTSSSLIQRAKAHDQDAWRRLVRIYGPWVDFWVRRTGIQSADADDVFQEVFAAVARGLEGFHKEQESHTFRGWLYTVLRNKVTDFHRRNVADPAAVGGSGAVKWWNQLAEAEPTHDPEAASAVRELCLRALALLRSDFEPRTWQIFWRSVVDGLPTTAVAGEFNVSLPAVRMAKSRVLRRLREELDESDGRR